ncbi:MAG: HD domain-containing protein, partial [Candidatus Nanohaloarchaea archaeon]
MTEIETLLRMLDLKEETRTGWDLRGVTDPESVADHSWGTALLCLLFGDEEGVDVDRCVRMALLHDLAEAETGDLPLRAPAEKEKQEWDSGEKTEQERAVMERFADGLDAAAVQDLWKEYEDQRSSESRFVKDMDMVEM